MTQAFSVKHLLTAALVLILHPPFSYALDLTNATIVVPPEDQPLVSRTAVTVLVEEVARRTRITLPVATRAPETGPAIVLCSLRDSDP